MNVGVLLGTKVNVLVVGCVGVDDEITLTSPGEAVVKFGVAMGSVVVGVGLAFGARKAKFTGIDHVASSCSAALMDSFHNEGW